MLFFVIGAPGSGKGTLCCRLCKETTFRHLSVGDHLRDLVSTESENMDKHITARVLRSELLPIEDILPILKRACDRLLADGFRNIILDGFPRSVEQARAAELVIGPPDFVLHFDCPQAIARKRYMTRSLPGRDNDPSVFDKRFEEFSRLNVLVVQEYQERGILFEVDSSDATEVSYKNLVSALNTIGDNGAGSEGRGRQQTNKD